MVVALVVVEVVVDEEEEVGLVLSSAYPSQTT